MKVILKYKMRLKRMEDTKLPLKFYMWDVRSSNKMVRRFLLGGTDEQVFK